MHLKQNYNKLLEKYRKAEAWFDDPCRLDSEITPKILNAFHELLINLGKLLKVMDSQGIKYTEEETLNGFKGLNEL